MNIIWRKDCDIVNLLDKVTEKQIRTDIPEFRVGDTVKVNIKIDEKDARGNVKTRIQVYEGLVMAIKGSKISKTFTVRKMSGNIGTEKTFPVNSPRIDSIEVVRRGKVRRAKLNYIRQSVKTPKIKERA